MRRRYKLALACTPLLLLGGAMAVQRNSAPARFDFLNGQEPGYVQQSDHFSKPDFYFFWLKTDATELAHAAESELRSKGWRSTHSGHWTKDLDGQVDIFYGNALAVPEAQPYLPADWGREYTCIVYAPARTQAQIERDRRLYEWSLRLPSWIRGRLWQ